MDYKVWLSFIIVGLLSLGLLSYKIATRVECPQTNLRATGKLNHTKEKENTFYTNEAITFNAGVKPGSANIIWDFGDKSPQQAGIAATHVYTATGNFLVSVLINNVCKDAFTVRITDGTISMQSPSAPVINPIVSGDVLKVNDENIFVTTILSDSYIWSVEELPQLEKITTPTAKLTFPQAGNYTVKLKLGDGRTFTKIVQAVNPMSPLENNPILSPMPVNPLPPPTPSSKVDLPPLKKEEPVTQDDQKVEVPVTPQKTYDQLPTPAIKAMLDEVVAGTKDVPDFKNILCNGGGTKVMANDKPTYFAALCMELKKKNKKIVIFKKEKEITSVKVVRDEANGNCISILYVNYK